MQFDNKIGSIQQILTATNVGVLRRQAILKELNLKKTNKLSILVVVVDTS